MTLDLEILKTRPIRALVWREPYGTLMLHGKDETRTRATKYRGWVLICNGKASWGNQDIENISGLKQAERIKGITQNLPAWLGYAIGVGYLYDCVPMEEKDEDKCFVQHKEGLWRYKFKNVTPIKPFRYQGHQGWRELRNDVKEKIVLL